jgi:hypothetical protein
VFGATREVGMAASASKLAWSRRRRVKMHPGRFTIVKRAAASSNPLKRLHGIACSIEQYAKLTGRVFVVDGGLVDWSRFGSEPLPRARPVSRELHLSTVEVVPA